MWTNSVIGQSAKQEEKEVTEQKNINYSSINNRSNINSNSRSNNSNSSSNNRSNSLGNAQRFRRTKKERRGTGRPSAAVAARAVVVHAMEEAEQE